MLDYIYHMTLKYLKITFFGVKTSRFCHIFTQRHNGGYYVTLLDP